jgi:hypothetical protein
MQNRQNTQQINSFASADAFLGTRTRKNIPSIRSTFIVRLPCGEIALIYHRTQVITWYQDGRIILHSGGHHTVTTKRRINKYGPKGLNVYQRAFVWYVSRNSQCDDASKTLFHEGMNVGINPLPFPHHFRTQSRMDFA